METRAYLQTTAELCTALNTTEINHVIDLFENAYHEGRTIFLFGNGGSGANASHFAQDLTKGTVPSLTTPKRLRTISLTDNISHILALANDEGYETIFEQQMIGLARPGDIAVGISGSGNSENVLRAIRYANEHGMTTVGFTGYDGGKLRPMVAYNVHVPSYDMGLVESIHGVVVHLIITELKQRISKVTG